MSALGSLLIVGEIVSSGSSRVYAFSGGGRIQIRASWENVPLYRDTLSSVTGCVCTVSPATILRVSWPSTPRLQAVHPAIIWPFN